MKPLPPRRRNLKYYEKTEKKKEKFISGISRRKRRGHDEREA
jgi:hypothetical protein